MKQFRPLCILVLLMILSSTQVSAREGTTTNVSNGATVYLPTSDDLCDIYIVDGTITFKASSTGTLANYRDNGVAFKLVLLLCLILRAMALTRQSTRLACSTLMPRPTTAVVQ